MVGANIRATHLAAGVATITQTNSEGNYTLGFLLPGSYSIQASMDGLKQFVRSGISVAVNDRLTLDIVMEMGQVNERVIVEAEAPLLETTSSSMGTLSITAGSHSCRSSTAIRQCFSSSLPASRGLPRGTIRRHGT